MKININKESLYHALAVMTSTALLCVVAIYNGYPLTFNNDSGVYIENGFGSVVADDRPILYGLLIFFGSFQLSLWFVIIIQSLILSTVLYFTFKYFCAEKNYIKYYLAFVAFVSLLMGASYEASWLMPDVFTSISILSISLLVFVKDLKLRDSLVLIFITIVSLSVHNSHFYICACLIILLLIGFIFSKARKLFSHTGLKIQRLLLILCLIIGANLLLASIHYLYGGNFKSSRGGEIFLISNMVEMGIIDTYLKENCEKHNYKLCHFKDSIPNNFLWDENSPIKKTGGWSANEAEYSMIVKDVLMTPKYLKTFIYKSGTYTIKQFFNYDLVDISKPTERINKAVMYNFEKDFISFSTSKETLGTLKFSAINFIQNLIVGACIFLYFLVFTYKKANTKQKIFIFFIFTSLILNSWFCSTFSGVFPRYQTRVIWLLPLPLFLFFASKFLYIQKLRQNP